jgi:hypothetical protein
MELNPIEKAIVDRSKRMTGNQISREGLEKKIAKVEFFLPERCNSTLCHLTMQSGYVVLGETSCLIPEEAQDMAFTAAFNRLWELESYLQTEMLFQAPVSDVAS